MEVTWEKIKLSKQVINKVIQKAPEYKKVIGEGIPVVEAAGKKIAPVGKVLKDHWTKFFAGSVGGAVVADDMKTQTRTR